jgi:hypothetical protein
MRIENSAALSADYGFETFLPANTKESVPAAQNMPFRAQTEPGKWGTFTATASRQILQTPVKIAGMGTGEIGMSGYNSFNRQNVGRFGSKEFILNFPGLYAVQEPALIDNAQGLRINIYPRASESTNSTPHNTIKFTAPSHSIGIKDATGPKTMANYAPVELVVHKGVVFYFDKLYKNEISAEKATLVPRPIDDDDQP